MITLALALLRSFVADRTAAVLSLVAPIAFFSLIAIFYRHLESPDGLRLPVLAVAPEGNVDAKRLVDEMRAVGTGPLRVQQAGDDAAGGSDARPIAIVHVPRDFSPLHPTVEIEGGVPLPGGLAGVRQLVELAHARVFAVGLPEVAMEIRDRPGRLLQESVAGIAIVFAMFSISSIASRGLALDAAGLRDRLRSVRSGGLTYVGARIAVMTAIGAIQIGLTLLWSWIAFGVRPAAPVAMLVSVVLSAFCIAAVFALLAVLCRTRARFVAIAPLVALVLGAVSGGMVPSMLLPDGLTAVGDFVFPSWGIAAVRDSVDGVWNAEACLLLIVVAGASSLTAAGLERKVVEP